MPLSRCVLGVFGEGFFSGEGAEEGYVEFLRKCTCTYVLIEEQPEGGRCQADAMPETKATHQRKKWCS